MSLIRLITLIELIGLGLTNLGGSALAQELPSDYQEALKILGRQGDYKANVLKVNIPRSDLEVSVAGICTPTPFGFRGWR